MAIKPYRVDFSYWTENTASIFVAAETPEIASEGARQILDQETDYTDAEIISAEEYRKQKQNLQ